MSTQGPNTAGTGTNDTTIGTVAWTNTVGVTGSVSFASVASSLFLSIPQPSIIQLVNGSGSIVGLNHSGNTVNSSASVLGAGSGSDTWGAGLGVSDINSSSFGAVIAGVDSTDVVTSNFLKGTNFGFSIPTGATINGIRVSATMKDVSCFPRGTKIHLENGVKNVEDIKKGDVVTCFEENAVYFGKVVATKKSVSNIFRSIQTATSKTECTPFHRFYTGIDFVSAKDLKIGDIVNVLKEGSLFKEKITRNDLIKKEADVFNFEVEKYHTYFADGFAVHNIKSSFSLAVQNMQITVTYTAGGVTLSQLSILGAG